MIQSPSSSMQNTRIWSKLTVTETSCTTSQLEMNSQQIDRVIRRHVRRFDGIYSIDNLPRHDGPKLLVANTDPADRPGEHWIAISVDDHGNGQYFDSFGRAPLKRCKDYMNRHYRRWTYNRMQFQSVASELCGHYCIVWCLLNGRKIDLCNLLSVQILD